MVKESAKPRLAPTIEQLLDRHGPLLSSQVVAHLRRAGVPAVAARKQIQRANGQVHRLKRAGFPHNDQFLYLQDQYKRSEFLETLEGAFVDVRSAIGMAMQSMNARGGVALRQHFPILSGSPSRLKGHIPTETVLERMEKYGLIIRSEHPEMGEYVMTHTAAAHSRSLMAEMRARLLAEGILLSGIKDWIRKTSFGSFNRVAMRGGVNNPSWGQFQWDLTVPSYIYPLSSYDYKSKQRFPGFIVADVVLGKELTEGEIRYFLNKCQLMRLLRKARPFLGMLVVERASIEAMRLANSRGILLTTPSNLFGSAIGDGLGLLINTLTNAAAVAVKKPEVVSDLFEKLSQIEGAASNLRGPLFELLVGHSVRQLDAGSIDLGAIVMDPETEKKVEIDVLGVKEDHVCAYECKADAPNGVVEKDEVEDWLTRKVPRIRGYLMSENRFRNIRQEVAFWTTGRFSTEAIAFLKQRAAACHKYDMSWKDGKEVLAYLKRLRSKRLRDVFSEHFDRHPLKS